MSSPDGSSNPKTFSKTTYSCQEINRIELNKSPLSNLLYDKSEKPKPKDVGFLVFVVSSLQTGGRFCGKMMVLANESDLTFLSEEEFFSLFDNHFLIEYYQIEEGRFPEANGNMKYWHRYPIVAKKID